MNFTKRTFPNHLSHPVLLSTTGALFGIKTKPVEECRLLELNCGDGGNIIPMSVNFPQLEYVGVDSNEKAVKQGNDLIHKLGLKNIQILKVNVDQEWDIEGEFDFILVNRLYSWVSPADQKKIWETCHKSLSPNGIIYVNFNALPGWAEQLSIRKILLYRIRNFQDSEQVISEVKKLLVTLPKIVTPPDNINSYVDFFNEEMDYLNSELNSNRKQLFVEDFLGKENHPLYFSDFMETAQANGFRFLSNCDLSNPGRKLLSGEVLQLLEKKSKNLEEFEQYIDFFVNRDYREIMLCRDTSLINRQLDYERLKKFFVKAKFEIQKNTDQLGTQDELNLISESGTSVRISGSLMGKVSDLLKDDSSGFIKIEDLFGKIEVLTGNDPELFSQKNDLALFLLSLFINTDLLDFRIWDISEEGIEPEFYEINPLVKMQTAISDIVTNKDHYSVYLNLHEKLMLQELPLRFQKVEIEEKAAFLSKTEISFVEDILEKYGPESGSELPINLFLENLAKKGLLL